MNRERGQRVYRVLNWIEPSERKSKTIRLATRTAKATRPCRLWESDLTKVRCGTDGWAYLFNVLGVFQREWRGYAFDTSAVKDDAMMSVSGILASHPQADMRGLMLRSPSESQDRSGALIESTTLKNDYRRLRGFRNYQEAEMAMADTLKDYNGDHIHSSLGFRTPYEFLEEWRRVHN